MEFKAISITEDVEVFVFKGDKKAIFYYLKDCFLVYKNLVLKEHI